LEKLAAIGEDLQGKVFDVLGELFEETPLPNLMREAIRYGDDPQVQKKLDAKIDEAMNPGRIRELAQDALATDIIDVNRLRANMKTDETERWQSHNTAGFLSRVFNCFPEGIADIRKQRNGRYRISRVPGVILKQAQIDGIYNVRNTYRSVCFDPNAMQQANGSNAPELIGPNHPLLEATTRWLQSHWQEIGSDCGSTLPVLVDNSDGDTALRVLFYLEWSIHNDEEKDKNLIQRKAQFVEV